MAQIKEPAPADPPLPQLPEDDPAQAYAALPTRDLIGHVQKVGNRRTDPRAQVIFNAFYYKYHRYLMTVVSNSLSFLYEEDVIQEIVDEAFAAFFRASIIFDCSRADSDKGCDQLVRSYLGKLARWKAKDARSFQESFGVDNLDIETIDKHLCANAHAGVLDTAKKSEKDAPHPKTDEVARWIAGLSDFGRDVLHTYFLDDLSGRKSERLPNGVAARLASKYSVTTSNVRKMKSKLERELSEILGLPLKD